MKQTLLILPAFLLCLLTHSCKKESVSANEAQQRLAFNCGAVTKVFTEVDADVMKSDANGFKAYGRFYHLGDWHELANDPAVWDSEESLFLVSPSKCFNPQMSNDFYAAYPCGIDIIGESTDVTFKYSPLPDDDVVVAKTTGVTETPINLNFNHALSRLAVYAYHEREFAITLSGIDITYPKTGRFSYNTMSWTPTATNNYIAAASLPVSTDADNPTQILAPISVVPGPVTLRLYWDAQYNDELLRFSTIDDDIVLQQGKLNNIVCKLSIHAEGLVKFKQVEVRPWNDEIPIYDIL